MKNFYLKEFVYVMLLCFFQTTFAQTPAQKEQITNLYDQNKLNQLQVDFSKKATEDKEQVLQLARQNGWELIKENADGSFDELIKVSANGQPIYYTIDNVDAAKSTRTNHVNSGGNLGLSLDGQNMTAYVWDGGGTRPTHQEFDGLGGNNRVSIADGSTAINGNSFHAMHVTGTIVASGFEPNAKGMAWQADAITYDWNNDIAEATTAAANGMLISNHSYGMRANQIPDQYFGAYIGESRDWDEVMYNAPYYLMVRSGGNVGNDNTSNGAPLDGNAAYDKMSGSKTSKNNMVVANGQDANVDVDGNLISVAINSSSSEGPTDDYRIKPDITGNGTTVYSTYDNSDSAYNTISGTSMASPNVAGTLLLLQQYANNVNGSFMRASTLKGLALHTADDAGTDGPDAIFGWGLLNARRAAQAITQNGNEVKIEELVLASGQTYEITVNSDGINDLLASISWTDPAGTVVTATNSNAAVLVNDLDIRVSQGTTTFNPWRLTGVDTNATGDNVVDPYERVDVANASGTYTITVSHKGTLTNATQNYSLIVTGVVGTPVVCEATVPINVIVNTVEATTAVVSWDAQPAASYNFRYRAEGATTWVTETSNSAVYSLSGLTPLTTYEAQVSSKCEGAEATEFSASINFTTTEVVLNYCDSASTNVNDEYISNVQLGSIDNTSGAQFYSDFTNLSTNLAKGSTAAINITPTWTGTVYDEAYAVWIDYNKDGDFTDAGEQVFTQAPTKSTPISGSFTVPNNATNGNVRMRVSMQYNAIPTSCQAFTYGEVEDYTVTIIDGVPDTEAPVITLVGNAAITMSAGSVYNEQGAAALDNVDGNLTASIVTTGTVDVNVIGDYIIRYNVTDTAGNIATEVIRTVSVIDTTAPVITLIGATLVELNVGDTYTEEGATAADNIDGNVTTNIAITGTVDTNTAGTYTINYNVSDAAGNTAIEATRTINVIDINNNPTYCDSASTNVNDEYISRVALESINNASGAQFYSDFTSISTNLTKGSSSTITVTPAWTGTIYDEGYSVWIDYNRDGDFTDAGEQVWTQSPTRVASASGSFIVPNAAVNGTTRMRVSMKYNGIPSSCETFIYGEVEDYTVNITSGQTTEVDTVSQNASFEIKIYPNPVKGSFLNVSTFTNHLDYTIYNMLGQIVSKGKLTTGIDVSELEAAVYVIEFSDAENKITKRFIKE